MNSLRQILVVDDERNVHYSFRRAFDGEYRIESAQDGDEALRHLARDPPDAVLLDLKLPGRGGLETLAAIRQLHPSIPVVVMTAYGTTETAIRATALSARDHLLKPVDVPALRALLTQILPSAPRTTTVRDLAPSIGGMLLGKSAPMQGLYKMIGRAAATDTTVLVTGESGTGKELVAQAVHAHGRRSSGPLVALNCAAIPESLLEAELFGHERGAFTGADGSRPGKFELADGGTLLLDEIGDMAPALQAKLLRALQGGEIARLGAADTRRFDVRVIALTNADLEARVADGGFREDLYYRLNVLRIGVPPLREREGDILLLAAAFLDRERTRAQRPIVGFTVESEQRLRTHSWPGNVRELENAIARAALRARGDRITPEDLALHLVAPRANEWASQGPTDASAVIDQALGLFFTQFPGDALDRLERMIFAKALAATEGNQVHAAKLLGTTRNVVRNRMKRHKL